MPCKIVGSRAAYDASADDDDTTLFIHITNNSSLKLITYLEKDESQLLKCTILIRWRSLLKVLRTMGTKSLVVIGPGPGIQICPAAASWLELS